MSFATACRSGSAGWDTSIAASASRRSAGMSVTRPRNHHRWVIGSAAILRERAALLAWTAVPAPPGRRAAARRPDGILADDVTGGSHMLGLVLAAGQGQRLRPYTDALP